MVAAVNITQAAVNPMVAAVEETLAVGTTREALPAAAAARAAGNSTQTIFQQSPGSARKILRLIENRTIRL